MKDLVSRADAINALCDECYGKDERCEHFPCGEVKALKNLPSAQSEIIRCKECKHFEYDHVENVSGIPLIVAHEICMRWCEGAKTIENGYCFLAERKDNG